ncbi:MAG: sugar phosphate isomerase/epimerase family protein [Candidatus Brocadiia bacterium]
MKLGLVTYNLAKDWDIDTIIEMCTEHGFSGVEPRTTHAHGVEVDLSAEEREAVRKKFEASSVQLAGLGSAFEYHSPDPEELKRNIEGTKEYAQLAADVGAPGIKVRPNALPEEVPEAETLKQIGQSLAECAEYADGLGIEVRLEVHGHDTANPTRIRRILDHAGHSNLYACWNSNAGEVVNGSVRDNFELLSDSIGLVHMRDLCTDDYPWLELLGLLRTIDYSGYCLAEIPESDQPGRIMDYYRSLWDAYHRILDLEA